MRIAELLLPEWDREIKVTRDLLERVPDDGNKSVWKPHEKSFPLAHLAQFLARLPAWVPMVTQQTELDVNPPNGGHYPGYSIEKTAALLTDFDRNATIGRAALAATSDEDFQVPWHLKSAGKVLFTQPRYMALRTSVLNHLVHHRAQLGLYLRLLGQPVPSMYGPTADTAPEQSRW